MKELNFIKQIREASESQLDFAIPMRGRWVGEEFIEIDELLEWIQSIEDRLLALEDKARIEP